MEINATLFVQLIVFAVFVWFTMKFVWPPLMKAMSERQEKIADGLAAALKAQKELAVAQEKIKADLEEAKIKAADLIERANQRSLKMIEEAKAEAKIEAQKVIAASHENLMQEVSRAKESLRKEFTSLAILGAEKILLREVDEKSNRALLNSLLEEI
jgi:F-type H+-transporting ATPase subunit b